MQGSPLLLGEKNHSMWLFRFASESGTRFLCRFFFLHALTNVFSKMKYVNGTYFACMHIFCLCLKRTFLSYIWLGRVLNYVTPAVPSSADELLCPPPPVFKLPIPAVDGNRHANIYTHKEEKKKKHPNVFPICVFTPGSESRKRPGVLKAHRQAPPTAH